MDGKPPKSSTRNSKTRDFYGTGGWCGKRATCRRDGRACATCFKQHKYEEKKQCQKPTIGSDLQA